jgi:hypothetical protein
MFKMITLNFHAGIAVDRLLGHYFLSPPLIGEVHHDIPRTVLPELSQDVDLQTGIHLMLLYIHNGAAPNCFPAVPEELHNMFPEHWIGRGGATV